MDKSMNKVRIEIIYFTSEFYRCITCGINQGLKKLGPDGVIKGTIHQFKCEDIAKAFYN